MKILDRYILFRFLKAYFFIVLILCAVLIVIDLAEKMENFNRPQLTAWRILTEYYLNFIPHYTNLLSPIIIFITAVFVTAQLAGRTEIVAMLSSGMSFQRILYPYFIGSVMIGILIFILHGYIVPNANKVRHNFEDNFVRDKFHFAQQNFHFQIAPNVFAYLRNYDNIAKAGFNFTLERIEGLELKMKLEATRMFWDEKKGKWTLESYRIHTFNGRNETLKHGEKMDTLLKITPKDFESKHLYHERLTLTELDDYIAQLRQRGSDGIEIFLIEKYERYAYPFAIVILTIIGVVVSAKKTRGGTGLQIAFGFVLAFIYIFLIVMMRSFAQQGGIPPQFSAWIPNLIFCVIGFIMYKRMPK
jgi:lipopolysaccharide export system permease protein